ncbi:MULTISPECIES: hypothetical protein [Anaeromyxobacter]|uniref:hypothetical protein n=2 Tax=Anaeromyxobacteraceae TaxID=1524215 RepID=UPI001F562FC9|nr:MULTISPECIES: hypothetical protein [unclassified Anaeromyxobacter]
MKRALYAFLAISAMLAACGTEQELAAQSQAETAASSYTITIVSQNPSSGVAITVSRADLYGRASGTTEFTRTYTTGTALSLTAPSSASGAPFQKWQKNGVDLTSSTTASITVSAQDRYTAMYGSSSGGSSPTFKILASNDLGMHCACPSFSTFMLLPPYNTLRAQVFQTGAGEPSLLGASTQYKVTYDVLENTDAAMKADPYFANWIQNSPKIFPGFQPVRADGRIQGLGGATLSGDMEVKTTPATTYFEKAGIPAYPVVTGTATDIMTDPLGGPQRTPYLTGRIQVVEKATGKVMASDDVTVPVAFGGCCNCHVKLAGAYGKPTTPAGSFETMGMLHARDARIDFSKLDPDGDGVGGPIRCSVCHWDPAMGESKAPGFATTYPSYKILPGATFTSADVRTSQYSFSDVLHRFHAQSSAVLTSYDANIAKNCYDCHPGNNVNCYRDTHTTKTNASGQQIWCTDCHGDLNQRIAQNQMANPWSAQTLPTCAQCHGSSYGEKSPGQSGWLNTGIFGKYLNSAGHHGSKVLCSSCHGSPHGLSPSTLAKDNVQNIALQNDARAIGKCTVCHGDQSSTWQVPPHN